MAAEKKNTFEESDDRFHILTESVVDSIIIADDHGNIHFWNKSAERIFGYTKEEVMGKPLGIIIPKKFKKGHSHGFKRFIDTGKAKLIGSTIEVIGLRKNGSEFPIEFTLSSWKTSGKVFVCSIIRDITERKLSELKIKKSHDEIKDLLDEIRHSITYAQRLQNASLPSFKEINNLIKNNFILFRPKDVVSGDFYWFEKKGQTLYVAVADCTGHGVPGAMVSFVCSNALNRALKVFEINKPSKILDKTRELVIDTFAKSGEKVKDGMDIALCAITGRTITFSGANSPLWIVRRSSDLSHSLKESEKVSIQNDFSLIEFKSNRQPVGLHENMKHFTEQEIELIKGDSLYFFTDGFADQFGGPRGKKIKAASLRKLILSIQKKPMLTQKKIIDEAFKNWKGDLEQIDDMCMIGIKIE